MVQYSLLSRSCSTEDTLRDSIQGYLQESLSLQETSISLSLRVFGKKEFESGKFYTVIIKGLEAIVIRRKITKIVQKGFWHNCNASILGIGYVAKEKRRGSLSRSRNKSKKSDTGLYGTIARLQGSRSAFQEHRDWRKDCVQLYGRGDD